MTEAEKRARRVCFTGHRPEKITRDKTSIKNELEQEIIQSISEGFNVFISGMARGVDIWAAQTVINLRDNGYPIKLICACPYDGFESGWKREWQIEYKNILVKSDLVRYICKGYSRSCFQIRNEWMVNHSAKVIAVFNGDKSGTKNTIDYAINSNVPVAFIKG